MTRKGDKYEGRTQGNDNTPIDFKMWDVNIGRELGDLCNEIGDAILEYLQDEK